MLDVEAEMVVDAHVLVLDPDKREWVMRYPRHPGYRSSKRVMMRNIVRERAAINLLLTPRQETSQESPLYGLRRIRHSSPEIGLLL